MQGEDACEDTCEDACEDTCEDACEDVCEDAREDACADACEDDSTTQGGIDAPAIEENIFLAYDRHTPIQFKSNQIYYCIRK